MFDLNFLNVQAVEISNNTNSLRKFIGMECDIASVSILISKWKELNKQKYENLSLKYGICMLSYFINVHLICFIKHLHCFSFIYIYK